MIAVEDHIAPFAGPYKVGLVLTLHRDPAPIDGVAQPQKLKLKIKKLQQPWAPSCGMVGGVFGKDISATTRTALRKLYYWQFASPYRKDQVIELDT